MKYHLLSAEQLADLSSGLGGPSTVAELTASRTSINLLRLRHLATRWTEQNGTDNRLATAITVLGKVQDARPSVYEGLLGDPLVGAWLTRASHIEPLTEGDVLQVGGLAVAGAMAAGMAGEATGWVSGGRVVLPAVGVAELAGVPDGPVVVTVSPDRSAPVLSSAGSFRWSPARWLRAEHGGRPVSIRLEDQNPFRDGYHAPPSAPLTAEEVAGWQARFAEAWRLLARYAPDRAAELAVGLRAIVPLTDMGDGSSRSGTARESVGALGMTPSSSPEDFVVTLVHEFQHSKLSAVLDLVMLYERDGTERHRAPWRADPRPTSGLIQGVYAFLAVADIWRRLRAAPGLAVVAQREFTRMRDDVRIGLEGLESSTELTEDGEAFVRGIRVRLDRMLTEPENTAPQVRLSAMRRPH